MEVIDVQIWNIMRCDKNPAESCINCRRVIK